VIGYAFGLLVEHVVAPQDDEALGERRTYNDPDARPLDVSPQELDVRAVSSRIVSYEIGGGFTVRHTISVALDVQHGDPAEARRLRDLIVLDLVKRALVGTGRDGFANAAPEAGTGQYVAAVAIGDIDYTPLGESTTNESAVVPFLIDTQIDG
jgi:hypothetical protein